ncbi:MAG: transcriptional regulator [Acidobacteria bacterium]|nr:transcriptional regulator [Acidobacteriota bacterium]
MATATTNLDAKRYGRLLARELPHAIETEEENDRALVRVAQLLAKGDARTPEELALSRLLVVLIEAFETEKYSLKQAAPHEILAELMRQHGVKQADLVPTIGSKGHVSDVLSGKKPISRKAAVLLARRFRITPDLFLA